ncbi:MAG: PAS domain S-box protein [Pseudomonadota bacterium]
MELKQLKPTILQSSQVGHDDLWNLLERAADGVWLWKIADQELFWSQKLADLLGYTAETLSEAPNLIEMTHPEDRERHQAVVEASAAEGGRYGIEVRLVRSDGEVVWISAWAIWHKNPGEPPHSMLGIVRDITERVDTKQRLEASESRFRAFFDQVPAAVFIKDEDSRHLYGNRLAAMYAGTDLQTFLGATTAELVDAKTADALMTADREVMQRDEKVTWVGSVQVPGEHSERHVWDTKFPIQGSDGKRLLGGIGIDVTALHETQKQLAVAQRLESMGLMASGVAHDFNNLLFAIAGNAELALLHVEPEQRAVIESILSATEHASELCRQLLTVGGKGDPEAEFINVGDVVIESTELMQMTLQSENPLKLEVGCVGCDVMTDAAQFRQVLVNLILNAKQASESGSTITLGVENLDLDTLEGTAGPEMHSWLPPDAGAGICVFVRDEGKGMSREQIERIFDPYYSDNELGHGLGLATVLGIVKAAHGAVRVQSTPGEGTRFEVFLQRVGIPDGAAFASASPAVVEDPSPGIQRIMVIDDHAEIVAIVVAWLERLGLEVMSYTSSALAVDVLRKQHAEFDAVITDISMPDIGGIGVLEAVRELDAEKPVVLASGFNDSAFKVEDDPRVWFLQKPYSLAELQRVLEEARTDAVAVS